MLEQTIKAVVRRYPEIMPYLKGAALWYAIGNSGAKSYEYFLNNIEGLVKGVYDGNVGGDFIDILKNLILGQISDAYEQAWGDEGMDGDLPDYLQAATHEAIQEQYDYVEAFYKDVVDARVDKTPIDPLLQRALLWANQWNAAYNDAVLKINVENGGKLVWREGDTVKKCETCSKLDGIVAYASEWEALGVHPQGFPNELLECKGGHCDCKLESTDQRRSPKAYDMILNIVSKS